MSPLTVGVIAVCESVGVGMIGTLALRALRQYPMGYSIVAMIVITICAVNTSIVITIFVLRSNELPVTVTLILNTVAGVVAIGISLLIGRSVTLGSRRLAAATRLFGHGRRFRLPEDPPTAEFAELARELARTSEQLVESQRREQAAEGSRRRLIAWISHDLRSPLARMKAIIESIEDGVVDDLPAQHRKIRSDTDRLTEMVDDLFELSRIQAGTLRLYPRNVALDDLVSDVVAGLDALAGRRGIRLVVRRLEPVVVYLDVRLMTRVVNNLLVNAIQYSPVDTAVSVDIRGEGDWAMLSVSDECGGIPARSIGSVFDMGWRGNAEGRSGDGGGGLGLAIVAGIVRAHQGRVSVFNTAGGCCFAVRVPRAGSREPRVRSRSNEFPVSRRVNIVNRG